MSTLSVDTITGQTVATKVKLPEGSTLQTKSMTSVTIGHSASGSTYSDTGLTVSITPKYATSKILVMAHINMGATNGYRFACRLMRDSTALSLPTDAGSRSVGTVAHQGSGGNMIDMNAALFFLDSPATTSATTYKIQAACEQSGGTYYLNRGGTSANNSTVYGTTSSITGLEIAQ